MSMDWDKIFEDSYEDENKKQVDPSNFLKDMAVASAKGLENSIAEDLAKAGVISLYLISIIETLNNQDPEFKEKLVETMVQNVEKCWYPDKQLEMLEDLTQSMRKTVEESTMKDEFKETLFTRIEQLSEGSKIKVDEAITRAKDLLRNTPIEAKQIQAVLDELRDGSPVRGLTKFVETSRPWAQDSLEEMKPFLEAGIKGGKYYFPPREITKGNEILSEALLLGAEYPNGEAVSLPNIFPATSITPSASVDDDVLEDFLSQWSKEFE